MRKFALSLLVVLLLTSTNPVYASWLIPTDRNPKFNTDINPKFNANLNPNFYADLNPKLNVKLNPNFNADINPHANAALNPDANPAINPKVNAALNPSFNTAINPKLNKAINPYFTADVLFAFDLNLKPAMYIVAANPDFLLFFNAADEPVLFGVKHSKNGYVLFDPANRWVGQMLPDSVGYAIFDLNDQWTGIVR